MKDFSLKVYLKVKLLMQKCAQKITLFQLVKFLLTTQLDLTDPKNSLKLIKEYIELTNCYYPASTFLSRNTALSTALFSALVNKYEETKSERILDQLLSVYKEEILRREENVK